MTVPAVVPTDQPAADNTSEIPYTMRYMDWAMSSVPVSHERSLRVLMALIRHADKKGKCWPSQTTIAAVAFGLDKDKVEPQHRERVRLALVWLRDQGLITYGHNPLKQVTIYSLRLPVATTGDSPLSQRSVRTKEESGEESLVTATTAAAASDGASTSPQATGSEGYKPNKYAKDCMVCGRHVGRGKGHWLYRNVVKHVDCDPDAEPEPAPEPTPLPTEEEDARSRERAALLRERMLRAV